MTARAIATKVAKKAKVAVKAGKVKTSDRRRTIPSVERAFKILEELGATTERRGLTFADLKKATSIPNGTLSYLLRTLIECGYVRYNDKTKGHRLGIRLIALGEQVKQSMKFREEEIEQWLQDVVKQTKLGAHLAVLEDDYAVYVQRVRSPKFLTANIWPGKMQIPHITAVGKALICRLNEEDVKRILDKHHVSKIDYPRAKLDLTTLREDLAETAQRGYAIDDEEHASNVRCVAAPVYGASGEVVAAIGVSASTLELSEDKVKRVGDIVRKTADEAAINLRRSTLPRLSKTG